MQTQAANDEQAPAPSGGVMPWAVTLLAGIGLALVAQFAMDSFADSSTLGHWAQHATLFLGGALVGVALLRLYQLGSRA